MAHTMASRNLKVLTLHSAESDEAVDRAMQMLRCEVGMAVSSGKPQKQIITQSGVILHPYDIERRRASSRA